MQKNCEHFMGIQEDEQVNPHTKGCEECEKEGSILYSLTNKN